MKDLFAVIYDDQDQREMLFIGSRKECIEVAKEFVERFEAQIDEWSKSSTITWQAEFGGGQLVIVAKPGAKW